MSSTGTKVTVSVQVGVEVRRSEAIYGILAFVLEVLKLDQMKSTVDTGVRQNQWLTGLRIVGLDARQQIAEELVFGIDWDRHQLHMAQGRGMITVPNCRSLVASVSPDLMTALRMFKAACLVKELTLACYAGHRNVPGRDASAEMGLGEPVELKYAGPRLQASVGTGDLDEVCAEYRRYGPA